MPVFARKSYARPLHGIIRGLEPADSRLSSPIPLRKFYLHNPSLSCSMQQPVQSYYI